MSRQQHFFERQRQQRVRRGHRAIVRKERSAAQFVTSDGKDFITSSGSQYFVAS